MPVNQLLQRHTKALTFPFSFLNHLSVTSFLFWVTSLNPQDIKHVAKTTIEEKNQHHKESSVFRRTGTTMTLSNSQHSLVSSLQCHRTWRSDFAHINSWGPSRGWILNAHSIGSRNNKTLLFTAAALTSLCIVNLSFKTSSSLGTKQQTVTYYNLSRQQFQQTLITSKHSVKDETPA